MKLKIGISVWNFFTKWYFSAHDTEKEEKDDFAGHGAIIDLRPGQNVSDDEDEDEPKKIKKKKKQKKPIEEDSSDTSNKSTRRTRPSSMPGWSMIYRYEQSVVCPTQQSIKPYYFVEPYFKIQINHTDIHYIPPFQI